MKVYNLEGKSSRAVANQFVIKDDNRKVFQSYDSTIIEIDRELQKITVGADWNYSRTTIKYFKMFLIDEVGFNDEEVEQIKKELRKAQSSGNNEFVYDGFSVIYDKDLR